MMRRGEEAKRDSLLAQEAPSNTVKKNVAQRDDDQPFMRLGCELKYAQPRSQVQEVSMLPRVGRDRRD